MSEQKALSDRPDEWVEVDDLYLGRFRQRWIPGAFGSRRDLVGVERYRVLDATWHEGRDGTQERTILRAEVVG